MAAYVRGAQKKKGNAALMSAAEWGHIHIVRFLCEDVGLTLADVRRRCFKAVIGGHFAVSSTFSLFSLCLPMPPPALGFSPACC